MATALRCKIRRTGPADTLLDREIGRTGDMKEDMSRRLDDLVAFWALLGGGVLLSIVAVTAFNIGAHVLDRMARPFGGSVQGFPGYEDYVRLTISCAALMLLPYCQLRRGHVAVDLFAARMPAWLNRSMTVISLAAMAFLAVFLFGWMMVGMIETRSDGAVSRVLQWPEWPFYLPGLASLLLWTLVAARDACRAAGGTIRR